MNKVSVIILNWNRKEDVVKTIDHLENQTVKAYEIIVVDNASTDGSSKYLKKLFPKVRILTLNKNRALAGFNYGMKVARGDFFIHLASDSMPKNNLIEKHLEKFAKNPNLSVSCPVTFVYKTNEYLGPNRSLVGDNIHGYDLTYFDGNGICLKRQVFSKTQGYSPEYFICLEELEWAVRILSNGFTIKCFTDVINYNTKSQSGSQRKSYGYYYARNWIWFYAKYLPIIEIPKFVKLHTNSFFVKTDKKDGSMTKQDIIKGVFAGIMGLPKFISERKILSSEIIESVKLDLFPNTKHLYV